MPARKKAKRRRACVAAVTATLFADVECSTTSEKVQTEAFGKCEVITLHMKPADRRNQT